MLLSVVWVMHALVRSFIHSFIHTFIHSFIHSSFFYFSQFALTDAMLTTLSNMGGTVGTNISTLLADIWDVSEDAIMQGDYTGIIKLTILTSLIQMAPLPFIFLIPKDKKEQAQLQKSGESTFLGGLVFVGVLFFSLCWTLVQSFIELA